MKKIFYISFIGGFTLLACKKEDPVVCEPEPVTLKVSLQPVLNGANYKINDIIESPQGYKYQYTSIKIVGTNVKQGSNQFSADFLYNCGSNGNLLASGTGLAPTTSNLTFNVGVPLDLNHGDPALPANTSALNITNIGDMHWGWNPGYKFVTIEGKVDTIPDAIDNFDHSFFFHLGTDFLFRTKTISDVPWNKLSDTEYVTTLKLNVLDILDGTTPTDLRVNFASHSTNTQMSYSLIVMDQFVQALNK
jgi:hypothetical protein